MNTAITAAYKYLGPDTRFVAAYNQFTNALNLIEKRPRPDYPNAVKDAVGAIEGVANIINGTSNMTLSGLMSVHRFSAIHGAIREMTGKLYAYRGDAEGAAHGAVGKPPVGEEEANLVITLASGIIAYLIAKFPEQPSGQGAGPDNGE